MNGLDPAEAERLELEIDLEHPAVRGRTGHGVAVAVIDSGVHPGHPHIGRIAGGIGFGDDGAARPDVLDRLGHGTAVAAAIQEKAPDADLFVVKVFDRTLSTTVEALIAAIDWAATHDISLVNLSLGTANPHSAPDLAAAVKRAGDAGTLIVSARESAGRKWYPGALPGVVGVGLDWGRSRHSVKLCLGQEAGILAETAGYPRPVPGVPPERNLKGVSFAVANATGILARLLQGCSRRGAVRDLARALLPVDGMPPEASAPEPR